MSNQQICLNFSAWVEEVGGVGFELPSGWVGRPGDEAYQLTSTWCDGTQARLEFDGLHEFIFQGELSSAQDQHEFSLSEYQSVSFTWRGRVTGEVRHYEFTGGKVTFHRIWNNLYPP